LSQSAISQTDTAQEVIGRKTDGEEVMTLMASHLSGSVSFAR
jgi:hypothetical protein